MYWTNFLQLTVNVKKNIFEKVFVEVWCPHLYASFGTFYVPIGQLLATQRVFKHSEELQYQRHFPSITVIWRFSNILQRLTAVTVPRIIDQFGRKRYRKKRLDVNYKLLHGFQKIYFLVHERLAVKNSFITDGLFWLNLYSPWIGDFLE